MLDWHFVEEDCEDTLLHLTSIFSSENDHLFFGKVERNTGGAGHTSGISVGREGAGIVNNIVGVEVLQLFARRSDEHVPHEQGMVGTGADNSDADTVALVPAGIAVDNVNSIPGIEVVDSTFPIDLPDLYEDNRVSYLSLNIP